MLSSPELDRFAPAAKEDHDWRLRTVEHSNLQTYKYETQTGTQPSISSAVIHTGKLNFHQTHTAHLERESERKRARERDGFGYSEGSDVAGVGSSERR